MTPALAIDGCSAVHDSARTGWMWPTRSPPPQPAWPKIEVDSDAILGNAL